MPPRGTGPPGETPPPPGGSDRGPRYTDLPLPPYRHRPGVTPHPERDPRGHRAGARLPAETFDPARWRGSLRFLYGVDLYNLGYYWEAHEAWEGLWRTTRRGDPAHAFLQGLILIAAARLKREQGRLAGQRRLASRGLDRLRRVAARRSRYCGVDLPELVARLGALVCAEDDPPRGPADPRLRLHGIEPLSG